MRLFARSFGSRKSRVHQKWLICMLFWGFIHISEIKYFQLNMSYISLCLVSKKTVIFPGALSSMHVSYACSPKSLLGQEALFFLKCDIFLLRKCSVVTAELFKNGCIFRMWSAHWMWKKVMYESTKVRESVIRRRVSLAGGIAHLTWASRLASPIIKSNLFV